MSYLLALGAVLATAIGVFFVVAGEADDSPGLQGLGVLLVLTMGALALRAIRRGARR